MVTSPVRELVMADMPIGADPLERSAIIEDPDTGVKMPHNEVVLSFAPDVTVERIQEIVAAENALIVGAVI